MNTYINLDTISEFIRTTNSGDFSIASDELIRISSIIQKIELNNASFRKITNLDFIGIGIISNKNITKGDEILVSYGFDYWLKRNILSI